MFNNPDKYYEWLLDSTSELCMFLDDINKDKNKAETALFLLVEIESLEEIGRQQNIYPSKEGNTEQNKAQFEFWQKEMRKVKKQAYARLVEAYPDLVKELSETREWLLPVIDEELNKPELVMIVIHS